ncbi:hypothetical protein CsSME_00042503 [Camellia sinensis var. sinensis]
MNSIILPHSPLFRPPLLHPQSNNNDHLWLSSSSSSTASSSPSRSISTSIISSSHYHRLSSIAAAAAAATGPSNEGAISLGDFVEKDWSFLDTNSDANRIISAGEIEESSRVLVWIGSQGFVEQLVDSSPPLQLLLVVHDSLLVLASIKEKYDTVKCWQGELIYVPHKWAPFDVFFLYFLPALPFQLHLLFQSLAKHCLPGNLFAYFYYYPFSFYFLTFILFQSNTQLNSTQLGEYPNRNLHHLSGYLVIHT